MLGIESNAMTDEITYISVIDTAVKIGFGAIITAVSGYFILRLTQRGKISAEYREEKRKYIGELLEAIGSVSGRALDFYSYIDNKELSDLLGEKIPEDIQENLGESNRKFYSSFEKITLLEGKYFVVAGEAKYRELVDYVEFLAKFHWQGTYDIIKKMDKWRKLEKEKREKLLASISEVYEQDMNT